MKSVVLISLLLFQLGTGVVSIASVEVPIIRIEEPPVVDGDLTEPIWALCTPCTSFITLKPTIGQIASERTITYSAYDSDNLYFAFKCFDTDVTQIKATLAQRDKVTEDDIVGVIIDAQNDGQYAPYFCSNALGVQFDAILDPDAEGEISQDFLYQTAGKLSEEGYTVEMRIPLKSLRYHEGEVVEMGIGFARKVMHNSHYYLFPGFYPERGPLAAQLGRARLNGLKSIRRLEILPSVIHSVQKVKRDGVYQTRIDETDVGVTAKFGVGADLVLDATWNPDFSQVEADVGRVDINLRFAQFYQEKRPFFMEGLEHYNLGGQNQISAIGAVVSTRSIVEPRFGLKMVGRNKSGGRYATMIAADKFPRSTDTGIDEDAYTGVFRYRQFYTGDNFLGGIYSGREYNKGFNRVAGIDFNRRLSQSTTLQGNYVHSFYKPYSGGAEDQGRNIDLSLTLRGLNSSATFGYNDVSRDFRLDNGYIPRDGIRAFGLTANRPIPMNGSVVTHLTPGLWGFYQHDKYWNKDEGLAQLSLIVGLPRNSYIYVGSGAYYETWLGEVYDISFISGEMGFRPVNPLYLNASVKLGGKTYYQGSPPYQGFERFYTWLANWQITEQYVTEFSGTFSQFYRNSDDALVYEYSIYRNRTVFHLTRYISFRSTIEYNDFYRLLSTDLLASYTYIPGTVIYLGYGSVAESPEENFASLTDRQNGLFFKASYNWRM